MFSLQIILNKNAYFGKIIIKSLQQQCIQKTYFAYRSDFITALRSKRFYKMRLICNKLEKEKFFV